VTRLDLDLDRCNLFLFDNGMLLAVIATGEISNRSWLWVLFVLALDLPFASLIFQFQLLLLEMQLWYVMSMFEDRQIVLRRVE
jgi:hypothetical protein